MAGMASSMSCVCRTPSATVRSPRRPWMIILDTMILLPATAFRSTFLRISSAAGAWAKRRAGKIRNKAMIACLMFQAP